MARHHQHSDSSEDGDSDAPEAVSLSQSKKQIQKLETTRKNAEIAERQSKREKNRERDRKLKERAERNKEGAMKISTKGKGKVVESQSRDDELQARMERAMQDAQEESDDNEDEAELDARFDEFEGISTDFEEEEEGESTDDSHAEEEDDGESKAEDEDDAFHEEPKETRSNQDHLPDELFAAAFASKPKRKTLVEASEQEKVSRPPKRRKSSNTQKDVVVGARAIRMLPNLTQPSAPTTLPSRKVKQFLDRTLALKGGKQRTKGWERRPVNIGVLRRDGPPVKFVRNA